MFLPILMLEVPIVNAEENNGNSDYCDFWDFDDITDLVNFSLTYNGSIEMIVGVDDGADYNELVSSIEESGGTVGDTIYIQGNPIAVVADVPLDSIASFAEELKATGLAMYLEPNIQFDAFWVPNDVNWTVQWGPRKIEADYAWNTTIGDPSVVVAVVDTGVDWDHPDLATNIWVNVDEVLDGIDNDGNGFVDDIRGWDFVDTERPIWSGEDGTARDNDPMDFHGHGTHCSGIVAAVTNNSIGIAGVAGGSKIMAVRAGFKDYKGEGHLDLDDVIEAIIYSTDNGADVISMSFGFPVSYMTLHEVIKYAYDAGVLLVAAAGNEGTDEKHYPAAYDEVVAVTATNPSDDPAAEFTNFGDWVEVAAPGTNIYSTCWDDNYTYMQGTSMAAPHVSGVAALVWSQYPNKTRDWVRNRLRSTADDLGDPGFDYFYGYGRINARKAVEQEWAHDLMLLRWEKPYAEVGLTGIKATVLNLGVNSESNIRVDLLVNGSLWYNQTIQFLASGAEANVAWVWFREPGKLYNLSVQVIPKPGEIDTENNRDWSWLWPLNAKIRVPDDYPTIQEAVDAAIPGNTILMASGVYNETVRIFKPGISLIGENRWSTIIDGYNKSEYGIYVVANEVYVSNLTVRNFKHRAIFLVGSDNGTITDNIVVDNNIGIDLWTSGSNTIARNKIASNNNAGLLMEFGSNNNKISENLVESSIFYGIIVTFSNNNNISNNLVTQTQLYSGIAAIVSDANSIIHNMVFSNYGTGSVPQWQYSVFLAQSRDNLVKHNHIKDNYYGIFAGYTRDQNNRIYQNNFINNTIQSDVDTAKDIWHNQWEAEGNYWSCYTGLDDGTDDRVAGDGIGDTLWPYREVDEYPLMSPWFPGDVNYDGLVDIVDVVLIALAYNSTSVDPNWNSHADLNEDGVIDDCDLNIAQEHFGEDWMTYWENSADSIMAYF